jgi:hypothetical protein
MNVPVHVQSMALERYARYLVLLGDNEVYDNLLRISTRLLDELTNLQVRHLRRFGVELGDTPLADELLRQLRQGDPLYRNLQRAFKVVQLRLHSVMNEVKLQARVGTEAFEP